MWLVDGFVDVAGLREDIRGPLPRKFCPDFWFVQAPRILGYFFLEVNKIIPEFAFC